jgi:VWFA-related protein
MTRRPLSRARFGLTRRAIITSGISVVLAATAIAQQGQDSQVFRFKTGVELINVTATVTDGNGRFVSGLTKEDFRLWEDGREQEITHFNAERVPVSLGLVVDTSQSMDGEKWMAARRALNRFLFELLDPQDEVFLYRFDNQPELIEGWTTDKDSIARGLARIRPTGATSMYDAVSEAIPLAQSGRHRKKALLLISDGNDTNSRITLQELRQQIRQSEVLVYAIGIDAPSSMVPFGPGRWPTIQPQSRQRIPVPRPFPTPGGRTPGGGTMPPRRPPVIPPGGGGGGGTPGPGRPGMYRRGDEPVNVAALRDITDDSGGRTEIVRSISDLEPATSGIADELSKQYYLGYPSQGKKDGAWHTIRVDVRSGRYLVRARRGYVATP